MEGVLDLPPTPQVQAPKQTAIEVSSGIGLNREGVEGGWRKPTHGEGKKERGKKEPVPFVCLRCPQWLGATSEKGQVVWRWRWPAGGRSSVAGVSERCRLLLLAGKAALL